MNIDSGLEVKRFRHNESVWSVAYSPDGTHIVSGCYDNSVRIWNIDSGLEVKRFMHGDEVLSVAYSPDGTHIVSGSDDKSVRIWNIDSGLEVKRFMHDHDVFSVAYSPDGTHIVSGSFDKSVRIWNIDSGLEVKRFMHDRLVLSVAYSPDETHAVSGSDDKSVRIWQLPIAPDPYHLQLLNCMLKPDSLQMVTSEYLIELFNLIQENIIEYENILGFRKHFIETAKMIRQSNPNAWIHDVAMAFGNILKILPG